jgi:hypothetical protein
MNPTPRLRFVERQHGYKTTDGKDVAPNMVRILQQWFAYDIEYPMTKGEWRDVPLEKE